jgi:hypothetical protein
MRLAQHARQSTKKRLRYCGFRGYFVVFAGKLNTPK